MGSSRAKTLVYLAALSIAAASCSGSPDGTDSDAGTDVVDMDQPVDMGGTTNNVVTVDVGTEDTGGGGDEDMAPSVRTIADYRTCTTSTDCPNGLGNCVKEVTLNRAAQDGSETVAVSDLFDDVPAGTGICTRVCTDNPETCADLSVNGTEPDAVPHECQLVFVDEAPYPDGPPAFPFDAQLDPAEQTKGAAFGAVCRPPFGLDDDVPSSICAACSEAADCDDASVCWDFLAGAPANGTAGTCLAQCDADADCPTGFLCDVTADGQDYCRPVADTCSNCRDVDGDGYGDGRCAEDGTVTTHDCDDFNADAYFDPDNMEHPFPQFCGEQDFNCNGLSDEAEQVGPDQYAEEHCTSCFDVCEGAITDGNAVRTCSNVDDGNGGFEPACTAKCDKDTDGNPTHADCNGDLSDGCELPVTSADNIYYRDDDLDGFGRQDDAVFFCQNQTVPTNFTQPDLNNPQYDCDDTASGADVYPGAPELCDGKDNNCDANGDIDENFPTLGDACTNGVGECQRSGNLVCNTAKTGVTCDAVPGQPAQELCDNKDNDCDGRPDVQDGFPLLGQNCTLGLGICQASGIYVCQANGADEECNANVGTPQTEQCDAQGLDQDCDGFGDLQDDDLTQTTYYADDDLDTYGDPNDSLLSCQLNPPSGYADDNLDCVDFSEKIGPNLADQESNPALCMRDEDGDGYGDETPLTPALGGTPSFSISAGTDCDDSRSDVNPGVVDICDLDASNSPFDNDCDGVPNDGCPESLTLDTSNSQTSPLLPASAGGADRGPLLCNDDEVLVALDMWFHVEKQRLQDVQGVCGTLELTDPDKDGAFVDVERTGATSLTGRLSHETLKPTVPPGDTQTLVNHKCTITPAGVIRSFAVEQTPSSDPVTELTVNCERVVVTAPTPTDADATVGFTTVGASVGTYGYDLANSDESGGCPAGTVAVGIAGKVNIYGPEIVNGNSWPLFVTGLQLVCRTLVLNEVQ